MADASGGIFPPVPGPFRMPFYYASLSSFWVFYRVDPAVVMPYLTGTGLQLATFDGAALASLDLQYYTATYGVQSNFAKPTPIPGMSVTTEIEFNVWCYPTARQAQAPADVSIDDFIAGQEQTKLIGGYRVWVPCDNKFAIQAGKSIFGENKFYTLIDFVSPTGNNPDQQTWSHKCYSPDEGENYIYSLEADLRDARSSIANPSPVPLYGDLNGRLVGSHWNLFGQYETYYLQRHGSHGVKLSYGNGTHKMRADMQAIIGSSPAHAVQIFQSAPAAAECRGFFANYPSEP